MVCDGSQMGKSLTTEHWEDARQSRDPMARLQYPVAP